ncbi:molybdopterin-dependent oxidoreductase [Thioclava sp. GXIMD4216]|uniref:molybdopterin-dependent oxidoreductase n=1 Tax=Thioclava sp. GXIMD4216 TaxID=3131929 RepID=UPI0030CF4119
MRYLKSALAILALVIASALTPLPSHAAQTVLTVLGAPDHDGPVPMDMAALKALPAASFTTTTTWTQGPQAFTGIYMADFLAAFHVTGGSVKLTAVNDYSVTVPVSDLRQHEALLAYERNGSVMSVRDKGPLWLVYPFDSDEDLRNEVVYSRSIWQVVKIEILQ